MDQLQVPEEDYLNNFQYYTNGIGIQIQAKSEARFNHVQPGSNLKKICRYEVQSIQGTRYQAQMYLVCMTQSRSDPITQLDVEFTKSLAVLYGKRDCSIFGSAGSLPQFAMLYFILCF